MNGERANAVEERLVAESTLPIVSVAEQQLPEHVAAVARALARDRDALAADRRVAGHRARGRSCGT